MTKAKIKIGISTEIVMIGLICNNRIMEATEVIVPPINCTNPVPTRLRTPSTSVITLDTNAPDL